ncbi:mediator of RNA polymerase II transcription subunit 12-like [Iris pallida]|uniref:Mediator of RNA polymerase II transcription subunit 12-like n=1 Tax=Iris pallida TaxID=29817 RepID=A0AAX6HPV6_IRIPA|nr:mediator of RNA polymerase II transcription subunit 12-like [Iris pallida]
MQRYSSASLGVSNNGVSGPSSRENARVDSPYVNSNYSANPRRPSPLASYKLKCEKESLNSRLGPPDFYPQTSNCPEETLTKEYILSGYKETVEGLEEAREIVLSQAAYFSKPEILKCKEAIRKRLRAINESRAQRRKAGQVYGVPLSGQLLIKPGVFPEQRACGEDSRRKWTELSALSQKHKSLRSLADHVPHGYRRKSLFEILIRNNVPLLRATWFIKVTYLNQVHGRPSSTSVSSGTPDKVQFTRTDLWTKDVIEYLQQLLDDIFSKDGFTVPSSGRDHSLPTAMLGQAQQRIDSSPAIHDVEEPSLQFKWWYMVRLLHWHYTEGLLLPSLIIEWVLNQLQEKESAEALDLLLPIISDIIESISSSQTYVRTFVDIAVRYINDIYPSGANLLDNSEVPPLASSLVEMLHYLIHAVPDAFVALDCSMLPACVVPDTYFRKASQKVSGYDKGDAYLRYSSIRYVVSTIQKRASNLAKIVNPSLQGCGAAKVLQVLDKAMLVGDVKSAYHSVFEDIFDVAIEERWIAEVSPCLRSSLEWIGTVSSSLICSIFFLCEWATCDFRDCRTAFPHNVKFTGAKDFSQVYVAVLLLKLRKEDMHNSFPSRRSSHSSGISVSLHDNVFGGTASDSASDGNNVHYVYSRKNKGHIFQSPGPLHDILVCWLDQHETGKGGGLKRLQVFIMELIRNGIFYPQAYLRQLIISGIMDRTETPLDLERRDRHHRILKQLPGSSLFDVLDEAKIAEAAVLYEVAHIYSNERQLVLHGHFNAYAMDFAFQKQFRGFAASKGDTLPTLQEFHGKPNITRSPLPSRKSKVKNQVTEVKVLISNLLHLPCAIPAEPQHDEAQGSLKRPLGSCNIKISSPEVAPGCEECRKAKRQKVGDERNTSNQVFSSHQSDAEDIWWERKGPKSQGSFQVEPPLKLTKNASRGRQKTVRKTQSLAQLAASRIESSQGASTSHVCDNKVNCPRHKSGSEGEVPKGADQMKAVDLGDIVKTLKQLRLLEKRSISIWLLTLIKQLLEGSEKAASQPSNSSGSLSVAFDDGNNGRWKLGQIELSIILYILDISFDLVSSVRLILWLLRKIPGGPSSNAHPGRTMGILVKKRESHVLEVGESSLLSALQRYENVFIAADLLPDVLATATHRAISVTASNGRTTLSASFVFARYLLKKYRDVPSVTKWEKDFRATCDQRLLAELDAGRTLDSDLGFPSGVSAGMSDLDEYFRQKMTGRISRTGPAMKEIVQRCVEEAVNYFYGKERKPFVGGTPKSPSETCDGAHQVAQDIVQGLVGCIRQNGGGTLEGDPSIVASAVSAIVTNVGPSLLKLQEFTKLSSGCVQHILHIHLSSLCLLKEALGERLGRIFDLALAAEASTVVSGVFSPAKVHRSQFQLSPETHDINSDHSKEMMNNSAKLFAGRDAKAAAAVSALVVGVIVHGVTSLERMIVLFKLKEGLDVLQFIRSTRSSSNGMSRGNFKLEYSAEVYVHWFRLLIGNCRTIFDGLVVDILGEPYILALSRMQRMLPLSVVFPPAYSIFAMVIWRPYILNSNIATREDIQLYHNLSSAIDDVIRHYPFRDLCLRNTHVLYDFLASDVGDSEFAAMLEMHNPDKHLKIKAFIPLRARMFLDAIVDCKMPPSTLLQEDGSWVSGSLEPRAFAETDAKLKDKLVHVFDTLQPAKFHWQWVELRLLLNEQALIEKIETDMSFVEAIRSLSPNAENFAVSESEKFLSEIVLTRILVRPDAAPLYAEIAHLLGRSLEESLVMDIKWILAGSDVLSGRKSIRQQLISVAQRNGLSTKARFWKPWGWSSSMSDSSQQK